MLKLTFLSLRTDAFLEERTLYLFIIYILVALLTFDLPFAPSSSDVGCRYLQLGLVHANPNLHCSVLIIFIFNNY